MAIKFTKSQICDDTISKITCHVEYYLCGEFHGFMKRSTIFVLCQYYYYRIVNHSSLGDLGQIPFPQDVVLKGYVCILPQHLLCFC